MTIYLGSAGHVELQRPTTEWMRTTVNSSDINVNQKVFYQLLRRSRRCGE